MREEHWYVYLGVNLKRLYNQIFSIIILLLYFYHYYLVFSTVGLSGYARLHSFKLNG